MKADGITLSTVGAGGGANPFLEQLAKQGGGRFYAATNPSSIPDIFLKETQQVSGQQIVEETFFPIQTSSLADPARPGCRPARSSAATTGRRSSRPPRASWSRRATIRSSPQWQYGLGRSVAWTSDSTGRWAKDWVGWSGFNRFFSQLVSWTFPGEETGGIEATFETTGKHDRAARRERRARRLAARLLLDQRQHRRAGPRARRRSTSCRWRPASTTAPLGELDAGRLRRPDHPDAAGHVAARADGRAGRADLRRVPPAGRQRAVPRLAARRPRAAAS